jgi:hypothetical protein
MKGFVETEEQKLHSALRQEMYTTTFDDAFFNKHKDTITKDDLLDIIISFLGGRPNEATQRFLLEHIETYPVTIFQFLYLYNYHPAIINKHITFNSDEVITVYDSATLYSILDNNFGRWVFSIDNPDADYSSLPYYMLFNKTNFENNDYFPSYSVSGEYDGYLHNAILTFTKHKKVVPISLYKVIQEKGKYNKTEIGKIIRSKMEDKHSIPQGIVDNIFSYVQEKPQEIPFANINSYLESFARFRDKISVPLDGRRKQRSKAKTQLSTKKNNSSTSKRSKAKRRHSTKKKLSSKAKRKSKRKA